MLSSPPDELSLDPTNDQGTVDQRYVEPENALWRSGPSYILGGITLSMTTLMIVGNGLVLSVLILRKNVRSPSNLLIGATSLNDFLTAVLYLIFVSFACFTNSWIGGDQGGWCKFSATFALISIKVTFMNISLIAIERLISIRLPLYYRRVCSCKKVAIVIGLAWMLVYLSGLLMIFLQDYGDGFVRYYSRYKQCVIYWDKNDSNGTASNIYFTFEMSYNFSLLTIMVISNGYVLFVLRYHVRNMNNQQKCGNHGNRTSFTPVYIRALTTTILVVTVFVVGWIPYYIIYLIFYQASNDFISQHESLILTLFDISWWMTYIGPIANPYFFAFRLECFKTVIRGWVSRKQKIMSIHDLHSRTGDHHFNSLTRITVKRSNQSMNFMPSPRFNRCSYNSLNPSLL